MDTAAVRDDNTHACPQKSATGARQPEIFDRDSSPVATLATDPSWPPPWKTNGHRAAAHRLLAGALVGQGWRWGLFLRLLRLGVSGLGLSCATAGAATEKVV